MNLNNDDMGLRNRWINENGSIYFITTTAMNWEPVFSFGNEYNDIVINSMKHLLNEHRSELVSYVIMPTHLHLIPFMMRSESISDLMRDLKKYTSTKIRQLLERDQRFDIIERLKANAKGYRDQKFKLWMDRFDDVYIYSEKVLRTKVNYIHNNPVKAGLVSSPEEWKYSSARNYLMDDHSVIAVRTSWDFDFA